MKFSVTTCCTVLASATVVSAEWSSFFKGSAGAASDTKDAMPIAHQEEEWDHLAHHRSLQKSRRLAVTNGVDVSTAQPTQTFYVPMPEKDAFNMLLKPIASTNTVEGNMTSLISFAISTDNTVVWYDHWEDGYDQPGVKGPFSQVWGDGDASNGCRPDIVCTNEKDYLNAGDTFILTSKMNNQRSESGENIWSKEGLMWDGRDKVQSSYPITMTRGGYAEYPGSLLAGAVNIHATDSWGTQFHSPVGQNTATVTQSFEWSRIFLMAKEANTVVDLPDGTQTVLGEGQSYSFSVNGGDFWKTSKPVQADLCVGDVNSNYEMRWFALLPVESWSNSYFSAVGDSFAFTKMVVYNPNDVPITVELKYRPEGANQLTSFKTEEYTISRRNSTFTRFLPTKSGGLLTLKAGPKDAKFIALSMTDTETTDANNKEVLNGQCYDWGFPVVPTDKLTPQVVVGWGYGCTNNDCTKKNYSKGQLISSEKLVPRSVVWVSPTQDADIYIDYQNTGMDYEKISMKQLESRKLRDGKDTDMSGAVIFATQPGTGPGGPPVDIAAAWGQDPEVSRNDQTFSLDLGTCVLPFSTIRVSKVVDKAVAAPGDILTYTIKIQNVGQTAVLAGAVTIFDPMMGQATYIAGSTKYSEDGGKSFFALPDDVKGLTPYPLDEGGLKSQRELVRRGGSHYVQFQILVDATKVVSLEMVNTGWVEVPFGPPKGFQASTRLEFNPKIEVQNVVYKGENGEAGCAGAVESLQDTKQTAVTYCFKITNTGNTFLDWVTLVNNDLKIPASEFAVPKLAPGDWVVVTKKSKILSDLQNTVVATGFPVFHGGATIPGMKPVEATDPSKVKAIDFNPSVAIENTLYLGHDGSATCNVAGVESVRAKAGTPITYCFKVTNTGNTYLGDLKIVDPVADNYISKDLIASLPPGESLLVSYAGLMPDLSKDADNNLDNMAKVTATPSFVGGEPIGIPGVSAEDPSGVKNTVEIDSRSGDKAPYVDPLQPNCMEDSWEDAGNSQNLVCRAKEVFLNDIHATKREACDLNGMINITVDASIHFNTARYDPGWYVAKDGGDALRGKCALSGLLQKHSYNVMSNYGTDAQVVGSVLWNKDFNAPNDVCGDVITDGGGGADILVPFMENVQVKCVDQNNDGNLDISVCFSWRVEGKDSKCTLDMNGAEGKLPDLYPATPSKCFCARYDIPEITVVPPAAVHISPC